MGLGPLRGANPAFGYPLNLESIVKARRLHAVLPAAPGGLPYRWLQLLRGFGLRKAPLLSPFNEIVLWLRHATTMVVAIGGVNRNLAP